MAGLTEYELATWNDSRQPAIYGVCSVLFFLGNVFVPMRLLSQWRTLRKILPEDYFLVAALLAADVVTVATLVAAHNGFGLHVWRVETIAKETGDITLSKMQAIFTGIWLTSVFNGPCLISIKLGLLFFYRRLFLANQKWFRIAWWLNMIYAVAWAIGSTIFFILQCSPPSYYWKRVDPTVKIDGKCSSGTHTVAIPLILSTVSDLAILILPVVVILGLHMSKENKLGLVALFGFGFVAVGCGIARLVVLEVDTDTASDPTYSTVAFEILNVVELNLAIICACVVPIFSALRRRLGGSKKSSSSGAGATARLKTPSGSHFRRGDTVASQPGEYLHLDDVSDLRAEISSSPPRNFSRSFGHGPAGIQVKTELYMSSDV